MWTEISTLLLMGLYCIGLCISIRFLLVFLFLSVCCFQRGWHIYLYRPLVLLFNAIAGLIDFSTARSAQRGCSYVIWRKLELLTLQSIAASETTLQTFSWTSLLMSGWFHFLEMKCKLLFFLFAENISVGFIFNGWWAHSYPTHSFDWFFDWFLTSWTPYYVFFCFF